MLTIEIQGLLEKGLTEARDGRYESAMELYDMALTGYPSYAEAWAWKAAAYAQLQNYSAALECAEAAITADPHYEWGYFRKACTLESMGEPLAAFGVYGTVLKINPDFRMAAQRKRELKMRLGM